MGASQLRVDLRISSASLVLVLGIILAACAPAAQRDGSDVQAGVATVARRTLTTVMRVEPVSLASKPLQSTGISIRHATRLFNAELDFTDARESPTPYLAQALPELNTESWRVFPDGRMETSYRLKPNLRWHDGAALTAEDFAFAWQAYATPEFGVSASRPIGVMEEVLAPDSGTVVIRWRQLYPDAGALAEGFQALPRHILQSAYQAGQADTLVNHPYWSVEYVGAGPYQLERWEPGAFIEAVAFDGHVLGRPKIERVVIRFMSDENTVVTNLLAGEIHFATDRTLRFQHAMTLRGAWAANNGGTAILTPSQGRYTLVQFRSEIAKPRAILDGRVRKAVAHATDRQALNEALFEGQGAPSDSFVSHQVPYFAEIERAIARYPYDPRRTEQLMSEAGFTRGSDGLLVSTAGERFSPELLDETGAHNEQELAIMADSWRRAGIDVQPALLPAAQLSDAQRRASFPAFYTTTGGGVREQRLDFLTTATIPSPENRWSGQNRGGWSSSEYDRLWHAFATTLDRTDRNRLVVQMEQLASEQLPALMLFFNFGVSAHLAVLKGPDAGAIDSAVNWNVHEWELR